MTTQPEVTTRIVRHSASDFSTFVAIGGVEEYIGSAGTHAAAEQLGREYRFNFYADHWTPEKAAQVAMEPA